MSDKKGLCKHCILGHTDGIIIEPDICMLNKNKKASVCWCTSKAEAEEEGCYNWQLKDGE